MWTSGLSILHFLNDKNQKKTTKSKDNIMFSQSIWRNSQYKYNVHLQNIIFMYNINTDFSILTGLNKMRLSMSTSNKCINIESCPV